jgi:hypothetical protein
MEKSYSVLKYFVFFWSVVTNLIGEDKTERTRQLFYVLQTFVTCFYTPASELLEGWKKDPVREPSARFCRYRIHKKLVGSMAGPRQLESGGAAYH